MNSQKHLFNIPADIHYLNGAYMSPLMNPVYEAGVEGMKRKIHPWNIHSDDFFSQAELVKEKFGRLIHAPGKQIAIIPSASYGLKSAVDNIPLHSGDHIIVVSNDFPSDYYTVEEWCRTHNKTLKVITAPDALEQRGATWNEKILDAIEDSTCAVVMSTVHWADGTKFHLRDIGLKCRTVNANFILDGTQSVGALPIDVVDIHADALVCAAYKWLLGPYSIGLAYYGEAFNNGTPIENSWMNRSNAGDFTKLTHYVDQYAPGASRYNVGEFSNFVLLPMLDVALNQLNTWGADAIQAYCKTVTEPLCQYLQNNGYWLEDNTYRSDHLFGFLLPAGVDKDALLRDLQRRQVFVSVRGDGIRVSAHVYNDIPDIEALLEALSNNQK